MSNVFGRIAHRTAPVVVRGAGCYLFDAAGRRYLDGSGGAAVACLGHGDAEVVAAVKAQLDRVAFAHTSFFTSRPAEELAVALVSTAPGDMRRVVLTSSGAEAVEAAIKLSRQYWLECGEPTRSRLIARRQSYHGATMGALSASGHVARRAPFAPHLFDVSHIEPCFEYRHRREGETLDEYGRRAADGLEAEIERLGAENVMAFIAETVVGATAGAVAAARGYFRRIREICDRSGVLLILDEVMCGMGRTGSLWAYEQEGVVPDIAVVAKGLGGGYQPLAAMVCSGRVFDAVAAGTGAFRHGQTFQNHPVAAAAGCAVLRAIRSRGLLARVRTCGAELDALLRERLGSHPHVGDIRGLGLLRAIELVEDRASKRPFDPGLDLAGRVKAAAMAEGLICYPGQGTANGRSGDHVLLAPPYVIGPEQLEELADRLARGLDRAFVGMRARTAV